MSKKKYFYTIPTSLFEDKELTKSDIWLYAVMNAMKSGGLTNRKWASRELGLSEKTIQRGLDRLVQKKVIGVHKNPLKIRKWTKLSGISDIDAKRVYYIKDIINNKYSTFEEKEDRKKESKSANDQGKSQEKDPRVVKKKVKRERSSTKTPSLPTTKDPQPLKNSIEVAEALDPKYLETDLQNERLKSIRLDKIKHFLSQGKIPATFNGQEYPDVWLKPKEIENIGEWVKDICSNYPPDKQGKISKLVFDRILFELSGQATNESLNKKEGAWRYWAYANHYLRIRNMEDRLRTYASETNRNLRG